MEVFVLAKSKVKAYRVMIGKTQQEMADLFGISKQAYSSKERGLSRFSEAEMLMIKKLVNKEMPIATIDDIFFS
jgi:DNA-binding XRE family transcriptional regulator